MSRPTSDVVICTMNRPEELQRCLATLVDQTEAAGVVRIVDASSDDRTAHVARSFEQMLSVWYTRSSPSTTRQRNIGIDASTASVIHFLDDDVELERDYLRSIIDVYAADREGAIGGVGGLPTNLPSHHPSLLQRLISPASLRQGAVLPSGRGTLVYRTDVDLDVDWLSGCCMSFRREVLTSYRFDDHGDGYVLGEDLDLSHRIRQHHRLVVTPRARLVHHESPRNRLDARAWAARDVRARKARVATRVGGYRMSSFYLDTTLQLALHAARGLRRGPEGRQARALAAGLAAGLLRSNAG